MHHPRTRRLTGKHHETASVGEAEAVDIAHAWHRLLLIFLISIAPGLARAQASPFMTGATALQTNARVAREYLVALPVELDAAQRLALVRGFSRELIEKYRFALDLTVHAPRDFPGSDPRNFHAHLLATTREITPEGLTAKTSLELNDAKRRSLGLGPAINELLYVRERWAAVTNEALRDAHIDARVDHRTLAAQGIDREPYPYIPRAAFEMERNGYRSAQAERLREEYRTRVEARLQRNAVAASSSSSQHSPSAAPDSGAGLSRPQTLDEIRRQAREDWLRMRQEAGNASSAQSPSAAAGQTREWADDDHLSR